MPSINLAIDNNHFRFSGCRFFLLILGLCIQNLCLWKNGCIKLPAFATGNRGFACFGCNELFILATKFHQTFDVDANTHEAGLFCAYQTMVIA